MALRKGLSVTLEAFNIVVIKYTGYLNKIRSRALEKEAKQNKHYCVSVLSSRLGEYYFIIEATKHYHF
ncbi:MAG: hypothetical protein L3J23_02695 [Flavobacteriaceae bacterium]|nr:hypothetical protein [Flavobacteriaceae bacterium]